MATRRAAGICARRIARHADRARMAHGRCRQLVILGGDIRRYSCRSQTPGCCDMRDHYLLPGRVLFAVSLTGFGVVCLAYQDFVNSLQPVPPWIPGYTPLALLTGIVLVVTGLAVLASYKVYPAAAALAAFLASWIVLLHVPSAFTNPELLRSPWWIRTFECLAITGAALVLAGMACVPVRHNWIRAGRMAFGISLPVFGILHLVYGEFTALLIPGWYPWPLFLAYLTGVGHIAAGVAIVTAVWPRLAAIVAGFMYATWALTLHLPRVLDHPLPRSIENPAGYGGDRPELTSLFVCVAFWGAAWIVAGAFPQERAVLADDLTREAVT